MDTAQFNRLDKKLRTFCGDVCAQLGFLNTLRAVTFEDILHPQNSAARFPGEFRMKWGADRMAFPLIPLLQRVQYAEIKLNQIMRGDGPAVHPVVIYYQLRRFQDDCETALASGAFAAAQFQPARLDRTRLEQECNAVSGTEHSHESKSELKTRAGKKRKSKSPGKRSSKKKRSVLDAAGVLPGDEADAIRRCLRRMLRRPVVSPEIKRARRLEQIPDMMGAELNAAVETQTQMREHMRSMEIELELLRGRQKGGPVGQKEVRDLRQAKEQLEQKLNAEQKRAETLQAELVHVADQLIATGHRDGIALAEAYNDLRQDYAGLEKQFQESARRNVELARMFEHVRSQHGLQPALEIVRQRINTILREAGRRSPQAMIKELQSEIQALRQVRTVLGGALFNLGLLLLHNGDRSGAIPELRAARELGVESAETNELLRSAH